MQVQEVHDKYKKRLCEYIEDALKDESNAKEFYLKVLDASEEIKDDKLRAVINEALKGIAEAEGLHFNLLKKIREQVCQI